MKIARINIKTELESHIYKVIDNCSTQHPDPAVQKFLQSYEREEQNFSHVRYITYSEYYAESRGSVIPRRGSCGEHDSREETTGHAVHTRLIRHARA